MLTLPNVTTQDNYVAATTLGPVATCQQIRYVVANKPVLAQIMPKGADLSERSWGDPLLITPESNVITRCQGMRFKSAIAGAPAQVIAQLIEPADPVPTSGNPFTGTLSAGGGVSPGVSSVQLQVDGTLVATEPILDLITGLGVTIVGADDPANTRSLVTLSGYAKKLSESILGGPAASVTFGSIPQTYRHLELVLAMRSDAAVQTLNALVQFNADAGANYHDEGVFGAAASAGGYDDIGTTSAVFAVLLGATANVNRAGIARVRVPCYSLATFEKDYVGDDTCFVDDAGFFRVFVSAGHWKNVAAITQIKLIASTGNFATGSYFGLYGIA